MTVPRFSAWPVAGEKLSLTCSTMQGTRKISQAPWKHRRELGKYLRWLVLKLESLAKCPGISLLWIRYLADLWWCSMTLQWSDPHFPVRRFLSISCWCHPSQELGTHGIHGMELWVIRCHEILARKNTTRWLCLEWPNPTLARIAGGVQVWPAKIEVIRV